MRDGRDRVERRARLVHQDHVGLDREAARDAQPLLLPARERVRRLLELVLDLVPRARPASSALLDDVVEVLAPALDARTERDVVVDRLRERVRLLEHHADAAAHFDRVDLGRVQVVAVIRGSSRAPRRPATRSFMRLNERSSVLLPQPDGPISAVMPLRVDVERHAVRPRRRPNTRPRRPGASNTTSFARGSGAVASASSRLGRVHRHRRHRHGAASPCSAADTIDLPRWQFGGLDPASRLDPRHRQAPATWPS